MVEISPRPPLNGRPAQTSESKLEFAGPQDSVYQNIISRKQSISLNAPVTPRPQHLCQNQLGTSSLLINRLFARIMLSHIRSLPCLTAAFFAGSSDTSHDVFIAQRLIVFVVLVFTLTGICPRPCSWRLSILHSSPFLSRRPNADELKAPDGVRCRMRKLFASNPALVFLPGWPGIGWCRYHSIRELDGMTGIIAWESLNSDDGSPNSGIGPPPAPSNIARGHRLWQCKLEGGPSSEDPDFPPCWYSVIPIGLEHRTQELLVAPSH